MLLLAQARCCKTEDIDENGECATANMRFCLEGAMQALDKKAVVIWSDALSDDLQQMVNTQYILRGCAPVTRRTGCAQRCPAGSAA